MKRESGRKTMQGTTITQGNTQRGSWLPTKIPYKYLRRFSYGYNFEFKIIRLTYFE